MKIAILVAGTSKYFPLFIDKPKCLYHLNGVIQLEKVIEEAKKIVSEDNIIVVAGYKHKYIEEYLKKYPKITIKINHRYNESSIFSFRTAIENENDDFVFMFGDESISLSNLKKISESKKSLALLCHDEYYYYSLGIIKVNKEALFLINDNKYLEKKNIEEIYCFANNKEVFDGYFDINSGICIGYIMIDWIRRIGKIAKIENPTIAYKGNDIDFIHYNPLEEYVEDLDYFYETDEYKNSIFLRIYNDLFSNGLKKIQRLAKKINDKFN